MDYLEKAAKLLDQAAKNAQQGYKDGPDRLIQCARTYAALAAIDKGLLPAPMAQMVYGDTES